MPSPKSGAAIVLQEVQFVANRKAAAAFVSRAGAAHEGDHDRRPFFHLQANMIQRCLRRGRPRALAIGAALALAACRSAYGVDPTRDPKGATATPGYWTADLTGSHYSPIVEERYRLVFDGERASVSAVVTTAADGRRHWERPVSSEAYAAFAKWALTLN